MKISRSQFIAIAFGLSVVFAVLIAFRMERRSTPAAMLSASELLIDSSPTRAADAIVEHVISCQPSFLLRGAGQLVVLKDSTNAFEAMWWNSDYFLRRFSLDTNQVYTFALMEGADKPPPGPRIISVYQGTQRIHDAGFCDAHQRKMELRPQRVTYGLYMPPDRPSREDEQNFPHRQRIMVGGCLILPNQPRTKLEFECEQCNEAFEDWSARKRELALEQLHRSLATIDSHMDVFEERLRSSTARTWSQEAIVLQKILEQVRIQARTLKANSDTLGSEVYELNKLLLTARFSTWEEDVAAAGPIVRRLRNRLLLQMETLNGTKAE